MHRDGAVEDPMVLVCHSACVSRVVLVGVSMGDGDAADTWQLLRQAILFENEELLLDLLTAATANCTLRDANGRTPLMLAAHNGRLKSLQLILHICPETMDLTSPQTGKTALHLCAEAGEEEATALLLSAGADPSLMDRNGYCALEVAHIAGHSTVAARLIDAIQADNARAASLHSRLLHASREGDVPAVNDLLSVKVNSEAMLNGDRSSHGVLFAACLAGRVEAASALLTEPYTPVHSLVDPSTGDTVLHAAISSHNLLLVKVILEHFPTLTARVNGDGCNALLWAVRSGNVNSVDMLLEFPYPEYSMCEVESHLGNYRFPFDLNAGDSECRTAVYLAVSQTSTDILSSLLSASLPMGRCPFEVDAYSSKGRTPLMLAAANNNLPMISILLSHGADVNLPFAVLEESESRAVGSGALMEAARANSLEAPPLPAPLHPPPLQVAQLLLEKGALDTDNRALRSAVQQKSEGIVRVLLSRLAIPDDEYKVNKRNVELGQMQIGESLLPSSLCPSRAVILPWASCALDCVMADWLASACLHVNSRLRTTRLAFAAITRADLSHNKLKFFPPLLWQLPSLRVLNLSCNSLTEVCPPSGYFHSRLIEVLILRENSLSSLSPLLLSQLSSLSTLDVSHNQISELPDIIWQCQSLKEVDASHNGLSCLPSNAGRGRNREGSRMAPSQPLPLSRSRNKENILVRKNIWQGVIRITQTEEEEVVDEEGSMPSISSLVSLNLSHNKFRAFPTSLACTSPRLQSLHFSHNSFSTVCSITALPAGLRTLDVSWNELTQLFSPNKPMGECHAGVSSLTPAASSARRSSPQRTSRSRSKSAVRSQRALSVSRDNADSHGDSMVCCHRRHTALASLKSLNISNNRLSSLVLSQGKVFLVPSLATLDASVNKIKELDGSIFCQMPSMAVLSFPENPLTSLPPEIGLLSRLWSLSLKGCPLAEPLASIANSPQSKTIDVVAHLRTVMEGSKTCRELKLVILGAAGVGKSVIADCFRSEGSHHGHASQSKAARTFTVKMSSKKFGSVTFSVWDSNGQPEFRCLHELVMCRRAVYIVVFSITQGKAALTSLLDTLVAIQMRAPHSCVVIVATHVDEVSSRNSSLFSSMESRLKENFYSGRDGLPRIVDILLISTKSRSDIRSVISSTLRAADETRIGKEKAIEQHIPSSHILMKKMLRDLAEEYRKDPKDTKFIMEENQLKQIVKTKLESRLGRELRDEMEFRSALNFVKDSGELIVFSDTSVISIDVLGLTEVLCQILGARSGSRPGGLLPLAHLHAISRPVASYRSQFVSLLHSFNIAVLSHTNLLLLPSLFADEFSLRTDFRNRAVKLEARMGSRDSSRASPLPPFHLLLHRVYSLSYVPTGLWPCILARVTSDEALGRALAELAETSASSSWILWQTGLEFSSNSSILCILKEHCPEADSAEEDLTKFTFEVKVEEKWRDRSLSRSRNIMLYLPAVDEAEAPTRRVMARVVVILTDILDTLLEDWFPSLGTRFLHSSSGEHLVKRIVLCPACNIFTSSSDCKYHTQEGKRRTKDDSDLRETQNGKKTHTHLADEVNNRLRSCTLQDIAHSNGDTIYSFTIEECIEAAMTTEGKLVCPSHGGVSLLSMCPDVSFTDIDPPLIADFSSLKKDRLLGRGAFGFVFRALHKMGTGQVMEVAVKMFEPMDPGNCARLSAQMEYKAAQSKWERDSSEYATRAYLSCRHEQSLIGRLKHSNTLSLLGIFTHPLALIIEMAPLGALRQLLVSYRKSCTRLSLSTLNQTATQIAKAIEYLHENNIVYRDLKSENVLVWRFPLPFCVGEVHLKLGDYGICRVAQPSGAVKGFGGTENFMAPEIVKASGEEEYTYKADVFSYGMLLYELLTMKLPFENDDHVKERILEGARPVFVPSELLWPSSVLDSVVSCWRSSPHSRPTSSQLVSMVSSPEWIHLVDAVVLDGDRPPIDVVSIPLDSDSDGEDAQVWMAGPLRLDVYSCTQYGWIEHNVVQSPANGSLLSTCSISQSVWLCDEKGAGRIYSTDITDIGNCSLPIPKEFKLVLAPSPFSREHVVVATSHSLHLLLQPDLLIPPSTSSAASFNSPFQILAIAQVNQLNNRQIWTGHPEGLITVHFISQEEKFSFSSSLMHPEGHSFPVRHLLASRDGKQAWSALEGCSKIFCWDAAKRKLKTSLDTKKVHPTSETIHTLEVNITSNVSCLSLLDRGSSSLLFVGTSEGNLLILAASFLTPLSAFRPYLSAIHSMTLIQCRNDDDTQLNSAQSSTDGSLGWMKGRSERKQESPSTHFTQSSQLLLTVGRQFRTLTNRFVDQKEPDDDVVAALWRTDDWIV